MSLNVDFDKLDRKNVKTKEYVFVTEDGKTATIPVTRVSDMMGGAVNLIL